MKDKQFELYTESQTRDINIYCKKAGYDLFMELLAQEATREVFITGEPFIERLNPTPVKNKYKTTLGMSIEDAIEVYGHLLTKEEINKLKSQIKW